MKPKIKCMRHVEETIEWARRHGYCFAEEAAEEYGRAASRQLAADENTAYYDTKSWVDRS